MTEFDLKAAKELIEKAGVRRVRTPAGAKRYGVPIGTPIGAAKTIQSVRRVARSARPNQSNQSVSRMRTRRRRQGEKWGVGTGILTPEHRAQIEADRKKRNAPGSAVNPQAIKNARARREARLARQSTPDQGVPITPEQLDRIKAISRQKRQAPVNAADRRAIANARRRRRDRGRRAGTPEKKTSTKFSIDGNDAIITGGGSDKNGSFFAFQDKSGRNIVIRPESKEQEDMYRAASKKTTRAVIERFFEA